MACEKSTVVLFQVVGNSRKIHFTQQPLAGDDHDNWIDIGKQDVYQAISSLMSVNKLAHSIVSVNELRKCGLTTDLNVTYIPV